MPSPRPLRRSIGAVVTATLVLGLIGAGSIAVATLSGESGWAERSTNRITDAPYQPILRVTVSRKRASRALLNPSSGAGLRCAASSAVTRCDTPITLLNGAGSRI